MSLNAVNVTGDQMVDFFYDDERMFWGHSVVVNSLNGTDSARRRQRFSGSKRRLAISSGWNSHSPRRWSAVEDGIEWRSRVRSAKTKKASSTRNSRM